jgi:hypothetical protein
MMDTKSYNFLSGRPLEEPRLQEQFNSAGGSFKSAEQILSEQKTRGAAQYCCAVELCSVLDEPYQNGLGMS